MCEGLVVSSELSLSAKSLRASPEPMEEHESMVEQLRAASAEAGFDLVQPLQVGWYNQEVPVARRLDDFGSEQHLAVIIGNTRALWPELCRALRAEPQLLAQAHPLDRYTEREIHRAVAALGARASVRFAHEQGERQVAIQRLAHVAGLAYLSESHLSVHAEYGPWIGLRAAVSFAGVSFTAPRADVLHPCGSCASRCLPAFDRALAAVAGELDEASLQAHWQLWLGCRDACPTGRQHRYGSDQILYHYLKDPEQLLRASRGGEGRV